MPFRAVTLALAAVALPLSAATLPSGFTETQIAKGIVRPTAKVLAPDGRLFICEQTGALRVVKDGKLLPEPFVTVPVFTQGERGLLGVTVDPDFRSWVPAEKTASSSRPSRQHPRRPQLGPTGHRE